MLEKECDEVLSVMFKRRIKGNVPEIQNFLKEENVTISNEDLGFVLTKLYAEDFLERLQEIENEKIVDNTAKMSITLKGIAFLRTDTFVNKKEIIDLDRQIKEQQILLMQSTIEANRIGRITNVYIAIFTFIAAEYYCYEFLRNYIPDSNNHKAIIVHGSLVFLLLLGIVGYLRIFRPFRLK